MFEKLLVDAGITKAELSRRLGISQNAVSKWRDQPPAYAVAYLKLLAAYRSQRVQIHAIGREHA